MNAIFDLANGFEAGDGVPVEKAKARALFNKAAALGDSEAAARAKRLGDK